MLSVSNCRINRTRLAPTAANRNFLLSNCRAREQQIRDVRARYEKHKTDRAKEHFEREANITDDLLEQWHYADGESAARRVISRVLLFHSVGDDIHIGLRLGDSDAWL